MSSPNLQIQGGNFQDAEGTVLNAGYLLFQLSHDENYASGPSQIVAGLKFKVTLNSTGSVPASPATMIYSNDTLLPSGSFYIIRAFKSDGTEAWASPQQVTFGSSPNPYDLGNIVPSNPPGAGLSGGGGSTLLLETNGTANSNQALLNIAQGTNITVSNSAGTTTISSTGGPSFTTSGQGYFFGPGIFTPIQALTRAEGASWVANQDVVYVVQFDLLCTFKVSKISINVIANALGKHAGFGIYSADGNTRYVTSGAMSVNATGIVTASITPVTLSPGTYFFAQTSDGTTAQIDTTTSVSTGAAALFNANASFPRFATAANASAGAVLPATLGALTAVTVLTVFDTALPLMEP